jgi:hypothetical protein
MMIVGGEGKAVSLKAGRLLGRADMDEKPKNASK